MLANRATFCLKTKIDTNAHAACGLQAIGSCHSSTKFRLDETELAAANWLRPQQARVGHIDVPRKLYC